MNIGEFCREHVITIAADQSIQQAAKLMKEENVGSVVVIEGKQDGRLPIGLLTDRDIAMKVVAETTNLSNAKVKDFMCSDLLVLKNDQDIDDAIEMMEDKRVRRAPVVEKNGKLCGIVTADDLLTYIAKELYKLSRLIDRQIKADVD